MTIIPSRDETLVPRVLTIPFSTAKMVLELSNKAVQRNLILNFKLQNFHSSEKHCKLPVTNYEISLTYYNEL